ncbi:MAG: aminopeptidase P N-terminal domain-containing protein [Cytophagaceae bacterium]|jgi:Xaa-Pro aminopeptidase|nr:aminopeptidase P N-terminal domain-containing protein [Cytophagaceae bacterium]
MRYSTIEPSFFITNRQQLATKLPPKTIAIFHSNPIYPTNADGVHPFKQNSDLFYFSGIDQEETILVLFPDALNPAYREILFILPSSEHTITWEGEKLSKVAATALSGIETVFWVQELDKIIKPLLLESTTIALNPNEHLRATYGVKTATDAFIEKCRQEYSLHQYMRLAPLCAELRVIKKNQEIEQLKKAIKITFEAFMAATRSLRSGCKEYELEAIIHYHFLKHGSRGPAYASIIASGKNANILHYIKNDSICTDGDLVLMDFGAEYGNYNADLTRVLPVSGKFSPRQKELYQSVLTIFKTIKKEYVPGKSLKELNTTAGLICTEECLKLGLLTPNDVSGNPNAYKKYFMHGIGHHLGLDVHDVHPIEHILEPGMVLTLEPGLYVPTEGIGIRLENNIVLTTNGNEDLMEYIPLEINDIENIMAE